MSSTEAPDRNRRVGPDSPPHIRGTLSEGILCISDPDNAFAWIEARDLRSRWVSANVKNLR